MHKAGAEGAGAFPEYSTLPGPASVCRRLDVYLDNKLFQPSFADPNSRWPVSDQFNADDEPILANIQRACTTLAARFLSPLLNS